LFSGSVKFLAPILYVGELRLFEAAKALKEMALYGKEKR
jgi:hypothetical protein